MADHLGYSGGVGHGVTSYFLQVLPALRAAGVELTACFLRDPHPAAETLRESGIHPIFLGAGKWNPWVVAKVASVARKSGAKLLHVTGLKATLAGRAAARRVDAAVAVHTHDLNWPVLTRPFQRLLARPTDVGICVSESTRELTIRGFHVRPERTFVIYNGIRLDDMATSDTRAEVRSELGLEPRHIAIGMIGRLYPVKGHREMLEMLVSIVARSPQVRLLAIGEGPERVACEALTRELGLQHHVRFLGQRADIPHLLGALDIVVMPSHSEGLGLAAVEALAAGKPVVAYAVGGLTEVIRDGINGRLVPGQDRGSFVNALIDLIEDEQQRARYGEQAVRDACRFSLDGHVERLVDCYCRAVATRRPSSRSACDGISG